MDSTILNLAIALTLRDALTDQLGRAIDRIGEMEGATDELRNRLSELGNVTIAGGLLAGAGIAGLNATINAIDSCVERYSELENAQLVLENKAFGKSLLDESQKDRVAELSAEAQAAAMRIGANTTFDSPEITNSMTALVKGGASIESVLDGMAEANANFAQVNRVSAEATADGTVQMASGFGLVGDEIMQAMEFVNQYADATISDSLDIQQALGNVAGAASNIWGSRDSIDVAKETIALTAVTTNVVGDESAAATYVRNFLERANMSPDRMTDNQVAAMKKAGWMDSAGHSAFIDYKTGMLKDIYELEEIIENGKKGLSDHEFSNVLNTVFQERGGKVASALALSGELDLANVDMNAGNALSIADQVEREMGLLSNIKDSYEEAKNNLMITLGEPFAAPQKAFYTGLKDILGDVSDFFALHPEVTKFVAAMAGGVSTIAAVAGGATMLAGAGSALRLMWGVAGPTIMASMAPVAGVMLPIVGVATALAGIGILAYRNWDTVGPHFENIGGKIGVAFSFATEKGGQFIDWLKPLATEYGPMIESGFVLVFTHGLDLIGLGLDIVGGGLSFLGLTFSMIFKEAGLTLELIAAAVDGDTDKINEIVQQKIAGIKEYISNVLGLLPQQALQWGKNLMDSFVNGIKSKLKTIPDALKGAADTIKSWIGVESPTKEGPLRSNHLWGGNLIASLSNGMLGNLDELRIATKRTAETINLSNLQLAVPRVTLAEIQTDGLSVAVEQTVKAANFGDMRATTNEVQEQERNSKAEAITRPSVGNNRVIEKLNIQVYGQPGQDEEKIAAMVIEKLKEYFGDGAPDPGTTFSPRGAFSY